MNKTINVMLVEDHPEYREVVEMLLKKQSDIKLTSQFGTAERALRSLHDLAERKEPDVILLDLNLPGMSGLEAIPSFLADIPDTKIIVLTQSDMEADVLKAITCGASGYLLKSSTLSQITEGIRTVMRGGASLDSGVARFILDSMRGSAPKPVTENLLSEREMEVLSLLADGCVKKEIAAQLKIGESTVVTHVSHIYEKLNAANAPAAIHKAHKMGLFHHKDS
jgi:DNA-binding NarL/FixJ family response regulator